MSTPQRALDSLLIHASTARLISAETRPPKFFRKGLTVLELGPGDSIFTGVIAYAMGAGRVWLVDAGPFAVTSMKVHTELLDFLDSKGFDVDDIRDAQDLPDLLRKCQAKYITSGVDGLSRIESQSVDFCFSNAVLEHISRDQFRALASEISRTLKPDGVSVHRVDLQDHLGGALNNLRFRHSLWESKPFKQSGFYTNRLRFSEIIDIFEDSGLRCLVTSIERWDQLPTPKKKMNHQFRSLSDNELMIKGFDLVLTHQRGS